jgi:hypothetical protein
VQVVVVVVVVVVREKCKDRVRSFLCRDVDRAQQLFSMMLFQSPKAGTGVLLRRRGQLAGIIGFHFKLNPRTAERTANRAWQREHNAHLKQEDKKLHEGGSLSLSFFTSILHCIPSLVAAYPLRRILNWVSREFCGRGHIYRTQCGFPHRYQRYGWGWQHVFSQARRIRQRRMRMAYAAYLYVSVSSSLELKLILR